MTDLRKAAEMALEALEEAAECVRLNYQPDKIGHDWDEQIEALRQALDYPTPEQIALAQQIRPKGKSTIGQALAQPEQEPVAWMDKYGDVLPAYVVDGKGLRNIPLYTAPPKREWVGLTDEEIGWLWHNSPPNSHEYARAIEAKLKEKNQ